MSIEKHWIFSEYADDIHNHLRNKEKKRYFYFERSYQLQMRKSLVTWMLEISDKLGFCAEVKHLAVYLLDIFMDNHYCKTDHLKMVAIGCLIVSVKVEEDNLTPRNSDFNSMIGNQYKLSEFVQMELGILKFFNCNLLFPTAAHFVDYYSLFALSSSDTTEGEPTHKSETLKVYVQRYIEYFLNITLLDVAFYKYPPSIIAAACILATRYCLSLLPPWPVSLQSITGYKYGQVKPCMDAMLRALNTEAVVNIASQICDSSTSSVSVNPFFVLQS